MILVFYAVHVAVSIFLVLVVLLQQGKGADLSVFGGGASQAAFGARGAATLLHKLTVACFVIFIMTTLSIGILQNQGSSSVMSGVDAVEAEAAEPAAPSEPEAATDDADSAPVDDGDAATGDGEAEGSEASDGAGAEDGANNQG